MGTKTIRLEEVVYERLKRENRADERVSETVERLIGGSSLLDVVGVRSSEAADEFRQVIEAARADSKPETETMLERFENAG